MFYLQEKVALCQKKCLKKAFQQAVLEQFYDENTNLKSLYEEEEGLSPNTIFCIQDESEIKGDLDLENFFDIEESCQMM